MSRHVVRWPMKVINGKKKKKEIPGMGWGGGSFFLLTGSSNAAVWLCPSG